MSPQILFTSNKPSGASTSANPTSSLEQTDHLGQPKTAGFTSDEFDNHSSNSQAGSSKGNGATAATALPLPFNPLKTEELFNLVVASPFKNAFKEKFQDIVLNKWFQEISATNDLDTTLDDIKKFFEQISNKQPCFLFHLQMLIKKFHQHHRLVPIEKAIDCIEHAMRCSEKPDNIEECIDIAESMAELLVAVWSDLTSNLKYEEKTKNFLDQLDEGRSELPTPYCVEWIINTVKHIETDFGLSKMRIVAKVALVQIISYRIHRITAQPELLRNFQASLPSASSHPVG